MLSCWYSMRKNFFSVYHVLFELEQSVSFNKRAHSVIQSVVRIPPNAGAVDSAAQRPLKLVVAGCV